MSSAETSAKSSKLKENSACFEAGEVLPRRFGRLTLLRQIARGGMGEVYLATAGGIEGAERACVVKLIRKEHLEDRSFLARFLDEARIQSQLHHPGVAQILEAATDHEDKPYVVVEHIEGRNLGEVRQRASQLGLKIDWADAVAMGVSLCEALSHVHERTDATGRPLEIVHRDLSPQNVMVGYSGELKVIDFGTAKGENRRCHTVAGIVYAKPGYVAPEVANETPGGVPADLYAVGIMLWELCAGRRFLSGEAAEHMAAVGAGERHPEPLASTLGCSWSLDGIIGKLTATRVEDRYASARAAAQDLIELLKTAPSLADGERGVRARIQHLMGRLYPAEPARSRAEFQRLVAAARKLTPARVAPTTPPPSPPPLDAELPEALLEGTRYRLLRELGRGASGVVYLAEHVDLNRKLAVKLLSAEHVGSQAQVERFKQEARAIAAIEHENVVRVTDFGIAADGRPFLAMELLDGETMEVRLARVGKLDWREAARLGVQVCAALTAAHGAGVIHRDIKPANLMLTRSGCVKLLDFGLSGASAAPPAVDEEALQLVGTPAYAAPEATRGAPLDPRADVYSLGVVLYEGVTGTLPFEESSIVALLDAKSHRAPQPVARRSPERGIPTMFDKIVSRALEPQPEDRQQSAEELGAALTSALEAPRPRHARRQAFLYAGVIVTLGLAVGAVGLGVSRPALRERASALVQQLRGAPPAAAPAEETSEALAAVDEGTTVVGDEGEGPTDQQPGEDTGVAPEEGAAPAAPALAVAAPAAPAAEDGADLGDDEASDELGPQGQLAEAPAAAPAAPAQEQAAAAPTSPLEAQLAEAHALIEKGQRIKGFNQIRKLGRNHRNDPVVLKTWSETAAQMRAWGEAARVARQWAAIDKGAEAQLHLARMQRAVGQPKEAVATLQRLLTTEPSNQDARSLIRLYAGPSQVARR